jgi:hypothetical protein
MHGHSKPVDQFQIEGNLLAHSDGIHDALRRQRIPADTPGGSIAAQGQGLAPHLGALQQVLATPGAPGASDGEQVVAQAIEPY